MTRPKPKTVRAWAFAWHAKPEKGAALLTHVWAKASLRELRSMRRSLIPTFVVGPVVRIEVPAPKERKR